MVEPPRQKKKKKKSICKVLCLLGKKLNSLQAILVDGKNSAETEKQILFLWLLQEGKAVPSQASSPFLLLKKTVINYMNSCCFLAILRSMFGLSNQVGRCGNYYGEITANKQRQRSKQTQKYTISDHSEGKLNCVFVIVFTY